MHHVETLYDTYCCKSLTFLVFNWWFEKKSQRRMTSFKDMPCIAYCLLTYLNMNHVTLCNRQIQKNVKIWIIACRWYLYITKEYHWFCKSWKYWPQGLRLKSSSIFLKEFQFEIWPYLKLTSMKDGNIIT